MDVLKFTFFKYVLQSSTCSQGVVVVTKMAKALSCNKLCELKFSLSILSDEQPAQFICCLLSLAVFK